MLRTALRRVVARGAFAGRIERDPYCLRMLCVATNSTPSNDSLNQAASSKATAPKTTSPYRRGIKNAQTVPYTSESSGGVGRNRKFNGSGPRSQFSESGPHSPTFVQPMAPLASREATFITNQLPTDSTRGSSSSEYCTAVCGSFLISCTDGIDRKKFLSEAIKQHRYNHHASKVLQCMKYVRYGIRDCLLRPCR
jgi:hypothetical protein